MATNPNTLPENSGRIIAPDTSYPYGSAKDDTTGTTGDGTPIKKALLNDTYGFYQWLLTQASIVPSGNAETVLASQLGEALSALFVAKAPPEITDFALDVRAGFYWAAEGTASGAPAASAFFLNVRVSDNVGGGQTFRVERAVAVIGDYRAWTGFRAAKTGAVTWAEDFQANGSVPVTGTLTITGDPTADDQVGDRAYNDLRYTQLSLVKDTVGTYALARNVSGGAIASDATVAGSLLDDCRFDTAGILVAIGASSLPGTWRNMSQPNAVNEFGLYKRVV